MSGGYEATFRRDLRLVILRILTDAPTSRANESLLTKLANNIGCFATRDQVRQELAWLKQAFLVEVDEIGGLYVATINGRGEAVARGRDTHPDVERPSQRS